MSLLLLVRLNVSFIENFISLICVGQLTVPGQSIFLVLYIWPTTLRVYVQNKLRYRPVLARQRTLQVLV